MPDSGFVVSPAQAASNNRNEKQNKNDQQDCLLNLSIYLGVKIRISSRFSKHSYGILTILCLMSISACQVDVPFSPLAETPFETQRSFIVAGHVYGSPDDLSIGMHPPFVAQFENIAEQELDYIFLTGDVVFSSDELEWETFKAEIALTETEYFIAPGNHDLANPEEFAEQIGAAFRSFYRDGDLFLILDSVSDDWSIVGEQLQELENQVAGLSSESNVFVFVHNIIWWDESNSFSQVVPNSFENYEMPNYWSAVQPVLKNTGASVYLFSGDFGATEPSTKLAYHQDEDFHYYMSGMGAGTLDHYLLVETSSEGKVRVKLVALGSDSDAFGNLEDYQIF